MASPEIVVTDETGAEAKTRPRLFSDPQMVSSEFNPVPYVFILKDANGNPIVLPPSKITNARVECPKFHVLLDHVVAVLWILYSKKDIDLLGSNQIHWALKFLEGAKNSIGQHTEDVRMAIEDLRNAYVDYCAQWSMEKLEERVYPKFLSPTGGGGGMDDDKPDDDKQPSIRFSPKTPEYRQFATNLLYASVKDSTQSGSVHLDDMLATEEPRTIRELIDPLPVSAVSSVLDAPMALEPGTEGTQKDVYEWRNKQFMRIIKELEELQKIDSTMQQLRCVADKEVSAKLTELLNQMTKEC